jgi:hypothetical protein
MSQIPRPSMQNSDNQKELAGSLLLPNKEWNIKSFLPADRVWTIRSSSPPALDRAWNIKPTSPSVWDKAWNIRVFSLAPQIKRGTSDLPFLLSRTKIGTSDLAVSDHRAKLESHLYLIQSGIHLPLSDDCPFNLTTQIIKLKQRQLMSLPFSIPLGDKPTYTPSKDNPNAPEASHSADVVILARLISKSHLICGNQYPRTGKKPDTSR